jgi:hypothetical protein
VLTWLAVALLTGAAVVAIGWSLRRTDELGECRPGGAMDERLADAPWLAPPGP